VTTRFLVISKNCTRGGKEKCFERILEEHTADWDLCTQDTWYDKQIHLRTNTKATLKNNEKIMMPTKKPNDNITVP